MRNIGHVFTFGVLAALMIACGSEQNQGSQDPGQKEPDSLGFTGGPTPSKWKKGDCLKLGDADNEGFNISTLLKDNGAGKSVVSFLTLNKDESPIGRVLVSDMSETTVEVVLCAKDKFQVNHVKGIEHFKGTEKSYTVSNKVDFKISLKFTHDGSSGFWIVGSEDDRSAVFRSVFADMEFNDDVSLRPTIRLTYTSSGPKTGTVKLSSKNTDIKIDDVKCKDTGIKEHKGWSIYDQCCPDPCS